LSAACFDNCVSHRRKKCLGEKPRKITRMRHFDKRKSARVSEVVGQQLGGRHP
jgi:hypothetical protein